METTPQKPIKRSKELSPLSRDHHDGLLLCWKIRTGLKNSITIERIADYVLDFFATDLKVHFEQEEKYLFTILPKADVLIEKALAQHATIRQLIVALSENQTDSDLLSTLTDRLEEHIRFEERTLFNHIEHEAAPEQLAILANELAADGKQHCKHTWKDEFWVSKK